ncbi:hypothetical protein CHL76_02540 [Marinococcus halophilus]|uniref:Uncharacterized protein n=1 Tax=Marinococcus halophilus TaxID=1371 RepID=A0A510Y1J6_MARHA|nr:hypothetical protein [Marinococcus halophilus]OZT81253.1 hypothetical protein CHL76_02540 [Marinococcus halophilus]GEK57195.1 hypothetical protein MHA01_01000 [Marinococcus halophilus]
MGKFYAIVTVLGLGIAGLFGYHWYDTESSIQTIHMHKEGNNLSREANVPAASPFFLFNDRGELHFLSVTERNIMSQKQQKKY